MDEKIRYLAFLLINLLFAAGRVCLLGFAKVRSAKHRNTVTRVIRELIHDMGPKSSSQLFALALFTWISSLQPCSDSLFLLCVCLWSVQLRLGFFSYGIRMALRVCYLAIFLCDLKGGAAFITKESSPQGCPL